MPLAKRSGKKTAHESFDVYRNREKACLRLAVPHELPIPPTCARLGRWELQDTLPALPPEAEKIIGEVGHYYWMAALPIAVREAVTSPR